MQITSLTGVLCAGNISHDILVRPVEEFRWGGSNWVDELRDDMGGNASNSSFALARLGVPVRLLGKVGQDTRGDAILDKLRSAGADVSLVERAGQQTCTTICILNRRGDRQFIQLTGASNEVFPEPYSFPSGACEGVSHYHQANVFALPNLRRHAGEQMRRARAAGLSTSIDTGWAVDGKWVETLAPALPHCDLMFTNEDEAKAITGASEPGAIAAALRSLGATDIILKLGAHGCLVFAGGRETHVPAFPVEAIDTTGAGDCFAAGFFAALYRGHSYEEAARVGNAVGAMVVAEVGATTGVRTWEETARRMLEYRS